MRSREVATTGFHSINSRPRHIQSDPLRDFGGLDESVIVMLPLKATKSVSDFEGAMRKFTSPFHAIKLVLRTCQVLAELMMQTCECAQVRWGPARRGKIGLIAHSRCTSMASPRRGA